MRGFLAMKNEGEIMDWTHVVGIVLGNAAFVIPMFLWCRSESRADIRRVEDEMKDFHSTMKDFHGRLCAIEERYLNWVMRDK